MPLPGEGENLAAQYPQLRGLIVFILLEPCLLSAFNFLNFMEGGSGNVLSWQSLRVLKHFSQNAKFPHSMYNIIKIYNLD